MKKIKFLLVLSLVLGMTTVGATNIYADSETEDGSMIESEQTVDIESLLSANAEQVKIDIQKQEQEAKKEAQAEEAAERKVAASSSVADKLESIAKSKLGCPYVWGATGPNGFDCSGFTTYLYRQIGISLPRVASDQAYGGKTVSKANLQKGDLVFFNTYGGISHVGMYIGGGNFVHASSSNGGGVKISNLNEGYYASRYVTASRYL